MRLRAGGSALAGGLAAGAAYAMLLAVPNTARVDGARRLWHGGMALSHGDAALGGA